jgi:stage V sporulation protein SpoVS
MNVRLLVSMCFAASVAFCQSPVNDPVRAAEVAQRVLDAQNKAVAEQPAAHDIQIERDRFKERFNKLITAMQEFTEAYNGSNGDVWPQKSADAVDKAFRELQKTESWKRAASGQLAVR